MSRVRNGFDLNNVKAFISAVESSTSELLVKRNRFKHIKTVKGIPSAELELGLSTALFRLHYARERPLKKAASPKMLYGAS